ncbi:hypothetical protein DKX38_017440 [Salix brachista]|uniref:Uncharacterized protein n=1 Tax=Salix brachista TaxID=2182728 RepID=A0A5N5KV99_9ROSI|nr:hypothetical protein DKX38_017440 [Salix brachista]
MGCLPHTFVDYGSWRKHGKNISDLVVARGIGDGKRQGVRADDDTNKSVGLSGKEFTRSVKDTVDIEDVLSEAAKDRSKAIQML